jgi:acyl-CoA thioester hydrolase
VQEVWSAPVRYAECDQQGIAFNSHYLTWCDEAATSWFATRSTPYSSLLARGLDTHVVGSELSWSAPVRWDDVVTVDAECTRVGTSSFALRFLVRVGDRACCEVSTTYVLVDSTGPTRVPDDLRAAWVTPSA